ncbi:hypothetical protein DGG96_02165 [Legionella qingyii]|uniref:Uncharacterized protein n=1 Tax=Legionella qingyii TaxID=2184757 RepID=A0A317U729_9GAMM|nr:hypothetical protein [Legionella qingyii]PWY56508.1 hypothetical protein DGG96_07025 [Legionella qingyii]PWY57135.1 hypothetical protein DGG96_02165 [Legionella qingyii]RUR25025.1 hypothetical protein ELY20_04510 [Legionella qingyii]RUR28703.1 hypothetical protein ELY16_01470 [Legionella qingyii]
MADRVDLKHNYKFFNEQLSWFKEPVVNFLKKLKFLDSVRVDFDHPKEIIPEPEPNGESEIPINFYDAAALTEATRGESYAVFPELQGKKINVFALHDSLLQRGVMDPNLRNLTINLLLQGRGAVPFGIVVPLQSLISDNTKSGIVVTAMTEEMQISLEVRNKDKIQLKIETPIQIPTATDLGREKIGHLSCELSITNDSMYIEEMNYTNTGKSEIAKEVFEAISKDYNLLSEMWNNFLKCLGIKEKNPELEIEIPHDTPSMG